MVMRKLCRSLLLLPLFAMAACNVVGDGNKIEKIEIKDAVLGRAVTSPLAISQCLRYNLEVLATFTDGTTGIYSDRATWSSSDETVVRVSNGDIQLPTDSTKSYAKGSVIPVGAGTATITVDYVGLKATLAVTVSGAVPTITIQPYSSILPRPVSGSSNLTIAPRTVQTYVALATLNGRVTDVTNAANWSVASPNTSCTNSDTANLTCDPVEFVKNSTSSFRAKRLDDSANPIAPSGTTAKTIKADFNSISGMNSCPVLTATLSVANFDTTLTNPIVVSSEFGASPPALFVGTTDRLKATATLRDASSAVFTQEIGELASSGDDTTTVTSLGLPIVPSTDISSNVVVTGPDSNGAYTTTDCRSKDLTVFSFTATGLANLIYAASSDDANPAGNGNSRNFYANFVTKPATSASTGTGTCPGNATTYATVTSNAVSVSSAKFVRQSRQGTLTSIDLCVVGSSTPNNSCSTPGGTTLTVPQFPQYSEDGARAQLRAIGHFTLVSSPFTPDVLQDITRSVTWTSSDSTLISVLNGSSAPAQAGQAAAIQVGTVMVTASMLENPTSSAVITSSPLTLLAQ